MVERTFDDEVEEAWTRFRRWLADRLVAMEPDEMLSIEPKTGTSVLDGESPYVDFEVRDGSLLADAASNFFLDERFALTPEAEQRMLDIGWQPPTYADADESGDPDFHVEVDLREADRAAVMAVRALREVYGCAHPWFLEADGLECDPGEPPEPAERIAVDLESEPVAVEPEDAEHLQRLVDDAMRVMLGDLRHDEDGDIPVPRGKSVVFVSVAVDRPAVDLYAELVCDALDVDRLPAEVEILNRVSEFGSFYVRGSTVVMRHRVCALPFVAEHLRILVATVCESLDDAARDIAHRVRGRRFLESALPAARVERVERHPAITGLLEVLHEDDDVSPAAVAALLDNDRHELIRLLVAIRTGRQSCDGLDQEVVLTHLRRGRRPVAQHAARPPRPQPPRGRSRHPRTHHPEDELGELPLDLEARS